MKTTFSYFPRMFENAAPSKNYLKKKQIKIFLMKWKIIDDFCLPMLNATSFFKVKDDFAVINQFVLFLLIQNITVYLCFMT